MIDRRWRKGDKVELDLPMTPRYVQCDPKVEDNHNRLAVTSGPLVYCAETADNETDLAQKLFIDASHNDFSAELIQEGILSGISRLRGSAWVITDKGSSPVKMSLIPYFTWSNRDEGNTMVTWLPTDAVTAARSIPGYGYLDYVKSVSATSTHKRFPVESLCDGGVSSGSREMTTPYWASEKMGQPQEVIITLKEKKNISSVSIYWTDRSSDKNSAGRNINKVPREWSISLLRDGQWVPMDLYITDFYSTHVNKFNTVHPSSTYLADGIKINITPFQGYTVGISEVKFEIYDK